MIRRFALITTLILVALPAIALDIETAAGGLATQIDAPESVTTLKISGAIDARDLFFIDDEMTSLRSLDLSGAEIIAYMGNESLRGLRSYAQAEIPARAFAGAAIEELVLPEGPITIADGAFAGSNLKSLNLHNNISTGLGAFMACPQLTEVSTGGANLGDYVFSSCPKLAYINLSGNTSLSVGAFKDCTLLSTVSEADELTNIANEAFSGCSSLESFPFGANVAEIGSRAFASAGIETLDLSTCASLRSIEAWAFEKNALLTKVDLPETVNSVGAGAFADCTELLSVVFPPIDLVDYVLKDAPLSNGVQTLIAEGTTAVGDYALKGAVGVNNLVLPSTLQSLGDGAMEGMTSLSSIEASALNIVPELGNDVWRGVEQDLVELQVADNMMTAFNSTPQWQEFRILGMSTTVSELVTNNGIKACFYGTLLCVRSSAVEIVKVTLYTPDGIKIAAVDSNDIEVQMETSDISGNVFIVSVQLANGGYGSIKLLR